MERKPDERLRELQVYMLGEQLSKTAQLLGDTGSWSRQRAMPLSDIIRCILGKQGLTTVLEIWRSFTDAGKGEARGEQTELVTAAARIKP